MNILHIIASMDPLTGGTCQAIRLLAPELHKLGVSIEVVSLDKPDASFIEQDSFPIHLLGPGKGAWQYNPNLIPWLTENVGRFDVVIVNGLWLYTSYSTWKTMRFFKTKRLGNAKIPKFFIMPHGMLDPWFQNGKGRELKALRNWIYWKIIENKVISEASGLLFTCETEMFLARKTFRPYFPKKEYNVGYGVEEPNIFSDSMREAFFKKCPEVWHQPYLLFLGRIHHKKGVDLLLKAYKNLLSAKSGREISIPKLIIAGPGLETKYGRTILKFVNENSWLKDMVFFPGMLTGDAKWGALYGCEAFILSSHQENFGIAVVEALACGRPVLISDQVNIWREIEANASGLISTNTSAAVEQMLIDWINLSKAQQVTMGKQARIAFKKHFHVSQAASQMLNVITSN